MRDDFFAMDAADAPKIIEASRTALDNLGERFGLTVLGTMDDDELMVGPSYGFPWTAYILADAPDLGSNTGPALQLLALPYALKEDI